MTSLDVVFRYATPLGDAQMRAINRMREVYGIKRVTFNQTDRAVLVEYDASRLAEAVVAGLLRRAGIDVQEKVAQL